MGRPLCGCPERGALSTGSPEWGLETARRVVGIPGIWMGASVRAQPGVRTQVEEVVAMICLVRSQR